METTLATYRKYESVRKKLVAFLSNHFERSDIFLKELNNEFVIEFETYLKVTQRMGHNSAMKDIRFLKKIIHLSVANEWFSASPFRAFKCSLVIANRDYLTLSELAKIENKKMSIERLSVVKDMFIFSCYTDLSYADIAKLSIEHLVVKEDESTWIITHKTKTNIRSPIPLLPAAHKNLNKYLMPNTKKPIMPIASNQKVNAYLKEIVNLCGINKHLTYQLARHTFATSVTLSQGTPIETVSNNLINLR